MSAPSLSNVFSDVYITGNCTVKGTISSLAGSITSQWTTSGTAIYYNGGNVGIGIASPTYKFDVYGTAHIKNVGPVASLIIETDTNAIGQRSEIRFGIPAFTTQRAAVTSNTYAADGSDIQLFTNSSGGTTSVPRLTIMPSGFVGIGTTNPGSLLTVSGAGSFGSGYQAFTAPTGGLIVQGNVGIGTTNPGLNALQVTGNVVTSGFTSNATNTVFNFDTLTVPFVNATQIATSILTTAVTGTALQVSGNLYATDTIASANPMMFRNRIINGDMRISQRGTSNVGVFVTSCYFIDRMTNYFAASSGGYTAYQNTLSTNDTGPYQQGFRYSANVVITSTVTSNPVLSGQVIEGWMVQDFNWGTSFGSSVTISYWFKSSATGTFSHGIRNQGIYTYAYTGSFTYSTAGAWQYVSYTIPPPPTGSVWRTDNLGSWEVWVGGSFQASAAAGWNAGASFGLSGSANWYSTGGYIAYTGFQLEKGLTASPFEFRPFAIELALCQRYFTRLGGTQPYESLGSGVVIGTTQALVFCPTPVPMRDISILANYTINVINVGYFQLQGNVSGAWAGAAATAISRDRPGTFGISLVVTVAGGITLGNAVTMSSGGFTGGYIQIFNEL